MGGCRGLSSFVWRLAGGLNHHTNEIDRIGVDVPIGDGDVVDVQ
jgi:hypothetical protein